MFGGSVPGVHRKGNKSKESTSGNKLYVREISTSKIFKGNKLWIEIIREISFGSKIIREIGLRR